MGSTPVVVGVDSTPAARAAVVWAAAEAELAQTSLLIVTVASTPSENVAASFPEVALRAADDVGRALLQSSVQLAQACQPSTEVRSLLSQGDPASVLVDLSAEAQLVVLGSQGRPMGEISLLGSRRTRVTVHAHCPVLLVGDTASFSYPSKIGRIIAGASETRAGRAALDFAAAEAARRTVPLDLIRFHPVTSSQSPRRPWPSVRGNGNSTVIDDPLTAEVRVLVGQHPGLAVTVENLDGDPADLLPSYSNERTMLVVGCRHSDDRWSTRLGPVATSVLHRSRGPVVVVGST
jgi:nucleotide-binding universal stress UspA family protein